jgi:hypothetical protein
MSATAPSLATWALAQVGSYLGYTGRAADVVARAAFDPEPTSPVEIFALQNDAQQTSNIVARAALKLGITPIGRQ